MSEASIEILSQVNYRNMDQIFVLFSIVVCVVCFGGVNSGNDIGSIVQLSKVDKKSESRMLRATLAVNCDSDKANQKSSLCSRHLDVKAWIQPNDHKTVFLLIDEVHDPTKRMNFPLLHPYIIQIANIQQTLRYPLTFKQLMNIECSSTNASMQRRQIEKSGKLNFLERSEQKRRDLFLYFPTIETTTMLSNDGTMSGSFSREKSKLKIKFKASANNNDQMPPGEREMRNGIDENREPISVDHSHGLNFDGMLGYGKIDSTVNRIPNDRTKHRTLPTPPTHSTPNHHQNRFRFNQHTNGVSLTETETTANETNEGIMTKVYENKRLMDVLRRGLNLNSINLHKKQPNGQSSALQKLKSSQTGENA